MENQQQRPDINDALRAAYPHLLPIHQDDLMNQSYGSAFFSIDNIRRHLKTSFPGRSFRVKAIGDTYTSKSTTVSWTLWKDENNLTPAEVKAALEIFEFWTENKPFARVPTPFNEEEWTKAFHKLFGGVHSAQVKPIEATPEQQAKRTKRRLQQLASKVNSKTARPNL